MKIMVVSDTHGRHDYLKRALAFEQSVDRILHLGDLEGGEEEICQMISCPVDMVKGNMDSLSDLKEEIMIQADGHMILMLHGHHMCLSSGKEKLYKKAVDSKADIVLFGHTHQPALEKYEGITLMNPGSISFPRPLGKTPSYGIIELDKSGNGKCEIRYIVG